MSLSSANKKSISSATPLLTRQQRGSRKSGKQKYRIEGAEEEEEEEEEDENDDDEIEPAAAPSERRAAMTTRGVARETATTRLEVKWSERNKVAESTIMHHGQEEEAAKSWPWLRRKETTTTTRKERANSNYLQENEEIDRIFSVTEQEDLNWKEANVERDADSLASVSIKDWMLNGETRESNVASWVRCQKRYSTEEDSNHLETTVEVHRAAESVSPRPASSTTAKSFTERRLPRKKASTRRRRLSLRVPSNTPHPPPSWYGGERRKSSVSVISDDCDIQDRNAALHDISLPPEDTPNMVSHFDKGRSDHTPFIFSARFINSLQLGSLEEEERLDDIEDMSLGYPRKSSMAHSSLSSRKSSQNSLHPYYKSQQANQALSPGGSSGGASRSEEEDHTSSIMGPEREQVFGERMRSIVSQFRSRASTVKKRLEHPPSPESISEDEEEDAAKSRMVLQKLVFEDFDAALYASKSTIDFRETRNCSDFCHKLKDTFNYIDPRGYINIVWLSLQALVFLYNAWVIPLRFTFPNVQTPGNLLYWLFCDYLGDAIYLLDLMVYKHHLMFMDNGFWVRNRQKITRNYVNLRKGTFIYDLLALLPTDLLYFQFGLGCTIVRLPRLVKVIAFWDFIYRLDSVLSKPYVLRIVKTVNYMLYLIHLNACAYYAVSAWEGIGANTFVYDGVGNAYVRCFYFATKTATSIGKNKKPTNVAEIVFMTGSWLMGVFVFAILIGDIRDIVSNARRNVSAFQLQMDAITAYMNKHKVDKEVQRRVKMWMNYTWEQQKSFDEAKILEFLPMKTRTDIAMRVHYHTLVKVKLFRNCEPGMLKDLVVLLKPIIYLPGDTICRKNDIGKEMFIIQSGQVQVLGGIERQTVLCTLGEGSVFGEIALLGVGGMNKRTADVVSVGFSNLFVLQKEDLEMVLQDYPDAKRILNARAKKLMKENEARLEQEKEDIRQRWVNPDNDSVLFPLGDPLGLRSKDPALLKTVMEVLPETSMAAKFLRKGSKAGTSSGYLHDYQSSLPTNFSLDQHTISPLFVTNKRISRKMSSLSQDESMMAVTKERHMAYSSNESTPYFMLKSPSVGRQHNEGDLSLKSFNSNEEMYEMEVKPSSAEENRTPDKKGQRKKSVTSISDSLSEVGNYVKQVVTFDLGHKGSFKKRNGRRNGRVGHSQDSSSTTPGPKTSTTSSSSHHRSLDSAAVHPSLASSSSITRMSLATSEEREEGDDALAAEVTAAAAPAMTAASAKVRLKAKC